LSGGASSSPGERGASQKVHIFAGREARTLMEYLVRFLVGGIVVSAFAVLGDLLRPKSFAGLFGAAPTLALATLSQARWKEGGDYASVEGRSMILGAVALAVYSFAVCQLLMRARWPALAATTSAIVLWLAVALGSRQILLG
jgi:hypothetical protein